ncbi:MAG: hypothetical protein M3O46_08635 [Myxococcota bacterium]|nr:hypothetical protein [Myxococcota bacterium]
MLVPAMAFAWWLVSMSTATPHRGAVSDEGAATAEPTYLQQQDAKDEATPPEQPEAVDEPGATDDTSGERVTLKSTTPEIVRAAKTFLDLPMGSERAMNIAGRRYVFVLERHFHPQGFVGGPHGWHKGVTVYGLR